MDGPNIYIKFDTALAAVRHLAQAAGDPFEVSARTLVKRLYEGGKLVSIQRGGGTEDVDKVYLVRRSVLGVRSGSYLHMRTADLIGETDRSEPLGPKPPVSLEELEDDERTIQ